MRTYDYILAMKEESQPIEMDPFDDDSDFSSDVSSDFDSPEKPSFISRFICRGSGATQVKSISYTAYIQSSLVLHLQDFRRRTSLFAT